MMGPKFGMNDNSPAINPSVSASGTPIIESPIQVSNPIKTIEPILPISHQPSVSPVVSSTSALPARDRKELDQPARIEPWFSGNVYGEQDNDKEVSDRPDR